MHKHLRIKEDIFNRYINFMTQRDSNDVGNELAASKPNPPPEQPVERTRKENKKIQKACLLKYHE